MENALAGFLLSFAIFLTSVVLEKLVLALCGQIAKFSGSL